MTNEQIIKLFFEHGYYLSFDHYDDDGDRSWSDIIHSQPESEYLNKYEDDPDFFDFMWYMRAECIKNAVYYVPKIITDDKEDYFHYEERMDLAIPLFSTIKDAELLYKHGDIPSLECCREIRLMDLINDFDYDVEFHINPLTDCLSVDQSFYINYLALAKNISEDRIKEIIEKRKSKRGIL